MQNSQFALFYGSLQGLEKANETRGPEGRQEKLQILCCDEER